MNQMHELRDEQQICPVCGSEEWDIDYDYNGEGEVRQDRCVKCGWPPTYPVTVQEWRRRTFFSEYLTEVEAALAVAEARALAAERENERLTQALTTIASGKHSYHYQARDTARAALRPAAGDTGGDRP